ncbi:MAG: DUF6502 family protein [Bdellovibrionota bacterium]
MVFDETLKLDCLRMLAKPLIRFALRHSISVQQIIETVKQAVVQLGAEEMERAGQKVNVSRLSAMTGLHRRDVIRLRTESQSKPLPMPLAARVVNQWENDKRFLGKNGRPRVLQITPERNEFLKLLDSVSTDLHPGTVLFELERIGTVVRRSESVKLVRSHAVPKGDVREGFAIVERDCDDLLHVVEENTLRENHPRNLHGRTEFDNIAEEDLPKIREWILREGGAFHKRVRKFLSTFDLDIHPRRGVRGGQTVSLTTFSRVSGEDL